MALLAVLNRTYDLKLPSATVGRVAYHTHAHAIHVAGKGVVRAHCAVRGAEEQLEKKQRALDEMGAPPALELPEDIEDTLGEAHALRWYDRKRHAPTAQELTWPRRIARLPSSSGVLAVRKRPWRCSASWRRNERGLSSRKRTQRTQCSV